ncbi:unnamed protein product [Ceratitis capitata]|uniref:(Mediterranean fruit fly) hypothetical protein n=1 Tax=Ceratitis capitata TaxID=7213 RepID=A0A811UGC9_CERCA|nr:unnamed protein product [Ceratitis capitata]
MQPLQQSLPALPHSKPHALPLHATYTEVTTEYSALSYSFLLMFLAATTLQFSCVYLHHNLQQQNPHLFSLKLQCNTNNEQRQEQQQ